MSANGSTRTRSGESAQAALDDGFLGRMIESSRARAAKSRRELLLQRPISPSPAGRFAAALRAAPRASEVDGAVPAGEEPLLRLEVIAEIKRASPSRGPISPGLNAVARARAYERAGAAAVSVLTEPTRFAGSLADLRAVVPAVGLPVLRKDFVVEVQQVREAAVCGAAATLLIAAALPGDALAAMLDECGACGIDALVEVHDERDLERALAAGAALIGINNRNLTTLAVDLETTTRLARLVPPGVVLVAESGIRDASDAGVMARAGADAVLVGELLAGCPERELPDLIASLRRPICRRPIAHHIGQPSSETTHRDAHAKSKGGVS